MELVVSPTYKQFESIILDLFLTYLDKTETDFGDNPIFMVGVPYECFRFLQVNNFKENILPFIFLDGRLQFYGRGTENPLYHYQTGMRIQATDKAIYKAGTEGIIIGYEFYNGYHRYLVRFDCDGFNGQGHWCRHQDIFPAGG
jgi:hypothetical protein